MSALDENVLISANRPDLTEIIHQHTSKHGVDLVLAGPGASNMSKVWSSLAPNGRLVLADSPQSLDLGSFDSSLFGRGASIATFSLPEMMETRPGEVGQVMRRACDFAQQSSLLPSLFRTDPYQISDLEAAVGAVIQEDKPFRRVMLECSPESRVPVYRAPMPLQFDPNASYLLVGCLGGLGRSIASWMRDRGARHFLFLSRSGVDKPEAAALIQDLQNATNEPGSENMTVQVVRGDVTKIQDVERAVALAQSPIRGVIQAAVVFRDVRFEKMTLEAWNAVIQPKEQGTLNIHHTLLNQDL